MRHAREPQLAMLQGLGRGGPRNMLIAGMGLGKSGAALLFAGTQETLYGRWPGMIVVAPLQVCFGWRKEIPLWRPDLRVGMLTGSAAERMETLRNGADIYVINYEQLQWLNQTVPNWVTLGNVMVADESTRLKHTRASFQTSSLGNKFLRKDGGGRTNAMAEHAHEFMWWLNMSGTPSPNGLSDLWGQYWYLDGGQRLGNSFSDFDARWFMPANKYSEFSKSVPQFGAAEEILRRVSDITTVVRTEDYYQLDKPIVVDRYVELPAKARKAYDEMKDRLRTEIEVGLASHQLSVLTAASKAVKLLQIAAGFAYYIDEAQDPDLTQCVVLHDAKIDALASILEETQEPLVVFYQHKATLELMQRKFKTRLRTLDKRGKEQDRWNEGKTEILAIQYQQGAEGLSLQHGGRNICFIEPTHWADKYAQAIERLGPIRQMQSGYQRNVNVFRILTDKTEDRRVFDNTAAKLTEQDQAVDFLRSLGL